MDDVDHATTARPVAGVVLGRRRVLPGSIHADAYSASLADCCQRGTIQATTPLTTFEVQNVAGEYQVVQIPAYLLPSPTLQIQLWTNNMVRISWPIIFPVRPYKPRPPERALDECEPPRRD